MREQTEQVQVQAMHPSSVALQQAWSQQPEAAYYQEQQMMQSDST